MNDGRTILPLSQQSMIALRIGPVPCGLANDQGERATRFEIQVIERDTKAIRTMLILTDDERASLRELLA